MCVYVKAEIVRQKLHNTLCEECIERRMHKAASGTENPEEVWFIDVIVTVVNAVT